jgi:shikimate kinase
MIQLIGPGGAGKSTIGVLLAERLNTTFLDLDRCLAGAVGDIGGYISRHGYDAYARANIEMYCTLLRAVTGPELIALSSGFMTYPRNIHPEYARVWGEIERSPGTFVMLPSLHRDVCVAETVRRQIRRPFGRSSTEEEAVIRGRFELYMAVRAQKVETMRPVSAVVDQIVARLAARNEPSAALGQQGPL